MGALDGRVAIITGAGRGLGREYALLFAQEGARVVVNNRIGSTDCSRPDLGPGHDVVEEIRALGGEAVLNTDDVADWDGARRMVAQAVDAFGGLDVLVNNAGILRDRTIVNMTEEEWEEVVRVNLRGHFAPTKWAASYWRDEAKAGRPRAASIINSVSGSGLFGMPGQSNYGSTKAAIAALTQISQAELDRYGVRANAVSPSARTRVTEGGSGATGPTDGSFDFRHPGNVAPFVAYLATANCPLKGKVFFVRAGEVHLFRPWTVSEHYVAVPERWTVAELQARNPFADVEFDSGVSIIYTPPRTE